MDVYMPTTPIHTYSHTHFSYRAVCQSANTKGSLCESEPARTSREEVRIQKTRGRRRSAGGTGALANFLRHVCVALSVGVTMQLFKNTAHNIYTVTFFSTQTFEVRSEGMRKRQCAREERERDICN